MNYDALYVNPNGRTSQAHFIPALIVVLAAIAFFHYQVTGRTAQFCELFLLYPLYVLLARRFQDIGQSAWLVLIPTVLMLLTFGVQLAYFSLGVSIDGPLAWVAIAVSALFMLFAAVKK